MMTMSFGDEAPWMYLRGTEGVSVWQELCWGSLVLPMLWPHQVGMWRGTANLPPRQLNEL